MRSQAIAELKEERDGVVVIAVKRPTARYGDEFLRLRCAQEMLALRLFPDFKEVTESFAVFRAVREFLPDFLLSDEQVTVFAVGDGCTPRTAATFAFRSQWRCYSIDPQLREREKERWQQVRRLQVVPRHIEDYPVTAAKAIIVAVHSHANLQAALRSIQAPRRAVVAVSCCKPQEIPGRQPDIVYEDWGIWSPERTVMIWRQC